MLSRPLPGWVAAAYPSRLGPQLQVPGGGGKAPGPVVPLVPGTAQAPFLLEEKWVCRILLLTHCGSNKLCKNRACVWVCGRAGPVLGLVLPRTALWQGPGAAGLCCCCPAACHPLRVPVASTFTHWSVPRASAQSTAA
ncbi:hypothetical protein H1C71_006217, partial [Ictidomys tridecemlineatus]